jgi:hypothetical protein
MRKTQSVPRHTIGARSFRVAAWMGMLIFSGGLAVSAGVEAGPPAPSMRVLEQPAGGIAVEWVREPGPAQVLGWHVERQLPDGGPLRLTTDLVEAGIFDSPSTLYRVEEASASARAADTVWVRLIPVDLELREWAAEFVPVTVEPAPAPPPARTVKAALPETAPVARAMASSGVGPQVRITLKEEGLYRLTAAEIASVLEGSNEAQVATAIAQTNLALTCGGDVVAWRGEAGGAALRFVGLAYRNTYTDRNVYWLTAGPGLAMETEDGSTALAAADPWFWETTRAEENVAFQAYLPGDETDDYFVWSGNQVVSPDTSWTWSSPVTLVDQHPAVTSGDVTAYLVSSYDGTPALDNRTRLSVPGQLLADQQWAGDERLAQTGTATNISGGSVTVSVELRRETGVATTRVLIDALEVRYARQLQAWDD